MCTQEKAVGKSQKTEEPCYTLSAIYWHFICGMDVFAREEGELS